jgi:hypothetical protein
MRLFQEQRSESSPSPLPLILLHHYFPFSSAFPPLGTLSILLASPFIFLAHRVQPLHSSRNDRHPHFSIERHTNLSGKPDELPMTFHKKVIVFNRSRLKGLLAVGQGLHTCLERGFGRELMPVVVVFEWGRSARGGGGRGEEQ